MTAVLELVRQVALAAAAAMALIRHGWAAAGQALLAEVQFYGGMLVGLALAMLTGS